MEEVMIKRLFSLSAFMLYSLLSFAQFSGSGSGTEESPYLIFNVTQLSQLSNFGGQSDVVFRLMKDLDLSEWIADNNPRQGWTPIGVSATPFQGKLLGENHKITGLSISRPSESYVGFFGYLSGAIISDLTIEGSDVTGESFVGALAGYATSSSFTNCHIKLTGKVSSSNGSYVGGFIGTISNCTISNFSVETTVLSTGANYIGGFGGCASNGSAISNGIVNGNVTSNKPYTGGFVGITETATITNVKVIGNVAGTTHVGGFIGKSDAVDTLTSCSYMGDLTGQEIVGGISAYLTACSSSTFTSCFTKGKITATGDYIGGIIGVSQGGCIGRMQNCSHFGDIEGEDYVGGIIGAVVANSSEQPTLHYYRVIRRYDSNYANGKPSYSFTTKATFYDTISNGETVNASINNCVAIGLVSGTSYVGGLMGYEVASYGYTSNAQSASYYNNEGNSVDLLLFIDYTGAINSSTYIYHDKIAFARSYLTFSHSYTRNMRNISMSNSFYSGSVKGIDNVGGLVGYKSGGLISKCYSMASIQGEINVGGIVGQISGDGVNNITTLQSNVSNNFLISASQSNVGRIYGVGDNASVGALGSTQGNRSLVTTKVVLSGILQEVNDDLQNGTSIGSSALKLKATYGALGWNYDNDWNQLETESYPYKKYQAAPPTITSTLESQATTISGKSVNGGTVFLYYKDGEPVSTVCDGNDWSFSTEPLQSGAQVQVYADAESMTPSYFSTTNVKYPGLGTEVAPYLIYTAEDLQGVNKSGYYKVMNDIDLTSWINENSPIEGWPAIGMNGSEAVYIDGDYHKIKGLWTNTTKDFNGLFSSFLVGQIKNLTVEVAANKKVKGGDYTGILIGRMANAKIVNCSIKGNVEGTLHVGGVAGGIEDTELNGLNYNGNVSSAATGSYIGGLAGLVNGGSIKSCEVQGIIDGTLYAGGLAGQVSGAELISLTFNGNLSSAAEEAAIGGLFGKITDCTLINGNAMPTITITGQSACIGGIIGLSGNGEISKSIANVNITASGNTSLVGGLVGYSNNTSISESNSNGAVSTNGEDSYAGGLVGLAKGPITNCYSTANVTGTKYTAGLVAYTTSTIDKCYAKGNVIGQFYGGGIVANMDGASAATTNCAAMNNTLSLTAQTAWACRVIGGYGNGCADPNESNYALSTMQVSLNGIPTKKYDDIMEGVSKTQAELMQTTTYVGMGWNMAQVWSIDENEVYPYLLWEIDANPVAEVSFENTTLFVAVGKTATIKTTVLPLSASNKKLNWQSDNTSVAVVDDGIVTAIAEGTANIIATSTDGSNISATCKVTVTANKDAAIAELQTLVDRAQSLYDISTEGENAGEYAVGSRATLLTAIENVRNQISSTMSDEAISECIATINAAIAEFNSKKVSTGEDTDISLMSNVVYIENVEANAGKQLTLSVKMKNTVEVQGFGFDLYLPDGVTVAEDEDGFSLVTLSTERTTEKKTNYFDSNIMEAGFLRVLASSTKGYTISGNDGEIVQIVVNIDKDMEAGDYPIILKEIALSDNNSQGYETAYVKSTLTISSYTPGDVDGNGKINVVDFTAIANYILGKAPTGFIEKAADVDGNGKVNVVDLTAVANLILYGTTGQQNVKAMKTDNSPIFIGVLQER